MSPPPAVAHAGRDKWAEVAVDVALVAGGTLLVLAAGSQLSGTRPVGLLLLVVHTAYAVAATVVLAGLAATTSQLPTLEETTIDGTPAVGVRSWAPPWWHTAALDLGLVVLGAALVVADRSTGGFWGVWVAVPALVASWFLVRVVLVAVGRRRRPALWLTEDHVVMDTRAGRGRADRADVRRVTASGRRLVVLLERDAAWTLCPRPWRRALDARDTLVLDCSGIGHRADDLASWLAAEAAAPPSSVSQAPAWGRARGAR